MQVALQRHHRLLAVLCLQALGGGLYAYYTLFATFRSWDDEGTFMLWDRYLLQGAALYDDVWNIYGPLPYLVRWVMHAAAGVPLTHDAFRLTTLGLWLATAALVSLAAYRMTRSLAMAALAHFLTLRYLTWITNEPGHSQEYLAVLLGLVALTSTFVGRAPRATLAALGAAVSGAVFIKVNAGAFMALALAAAFLAVVPSTRVIGAARWAIGAAWLAVPAMLLGIVPAGGPQAHGASPWPAFAVAYTAAVALVLAVAMTERPRDPLPLAAGSWAVAAGGLTGLAIVGLTIAVFGSSLPAILQGVFVLPSRQFEWAAHWSAGERLGAAWPLLAASAGVYILFATVGRARAVLLAPLKTAFGLGVCLLVVVLPPHRTTYIVALRLILPFLWIALAADGEPRGLAGAFPRVVLVACALAQALYVYPVTGTQTMLATFLFVACGVVALHDGTMGLLRDLPPRRAERWRFAGASLLTAALAVGYGVADRQAYATYRKDLPLNLPGTSRLRLAEEGYVTIFRWLAHNLRAHCDTFLGVPPMNSLYFWAGVQAPGPLSRSLVLDLFDAEHQQAMVEAFTVFPRRCAVLSLAELSTWFEGRLEEVAHLPLVSHIERDFGVVADMWGWILLVPNDRPAPAPTYSGCIASAAGDASVTIDLALPALAGGPIERLTLADLRAAGLLADTASQRSAFALEVVRPEGGTPIDLTTPQHVTLRTLASVPADRFVVVRLYDGTGAWRESVPVLGPCGARPG